MAAIELSGVTMRYANGQVAVDNCSLHAADGELLVLVGPSGSGKSTVLRLVAGLEEPTAGRITIDGRDVTRVPPQERDLAMVFQSYALYPHKTVRENLAFGLRARHVPPATAAGRVAAVAASLGLDGVLDRRPAELSGGQRQRVALGRAIVREPKAFLLDEPLSNLDPLLRVATRTELALLQRRLSATMIYVTHDQEEAMTLGARVAVMRSGIVEQVAAPRDLYAAPANVFVAGFVGSPAMNLWPASYAADGAGARAVSAIGPLPLAAIDRVAHGGPLVVGVRPHDIEPVAPGDGDGVGEVAVVEPLGPATLIHVRAAGGTDELVRLMAPSDSAAAVGDIVGFRVRRDRIHVFDGASGRRIG